MSKIFVDACLGKETPYTPVWMMRQAGRYLPEYMAVRAEAGNFLNLCHDPKKAAEVTIQPLDIVGVDAAILFSDILVIPDEMGTMVMILRVFIYIGSFILLWIFVLNPLWIRIFNTFKMYLWSHQYIISRAFNYIFYIKSIFFKF